MQDNGSPTTREHDSTVIYVNIAGTDGHPDGKSWATAFPSITEALATDIKDKREIWIAKGTYLIDNTSDDTSLLPPTEGITLYGGFTGQEETKSQRNWKNNQTILTSAKTRDSKGVMDEYDLVLGKGVLSITYPADLSHQTLQKPEIGLYISRKQCRVLPN